MTDSISIFPPGWRATDEFGEIVAGGELHVFTAGTTSPIEVFADQMLAVSLGVIVDLNAGGYPITSGGARTLVYTGAVAYRIVLKDAGNVTVWDHDHVRGALDTSLFDAQRATPQFTMRTTGSDVTILRSEVGSIFNVDCSGGNRQVTLPSAVEVEPGVPLKIRHAGSANNVIYSSVAGQTISIPGSTPTSITLLGNGETDEIESDGANWRLTGKVPRSAGSEEIGSTEVSVAVAAVDFIIPSGVSGFRVVGTGLSCSTTGDLVFSISDDGGASFETISGRIIRDNAGTVAGDDVETSSLRLVISTTASSVRANFAADVLLADKTAAKKVVRAQGASDSDNYSTVSIGESAVCGAINLVRIAFSAGNIDAGRIICQRL